MNIDWQTLLAVILPHLPSQVVGDLITVATALITICGLIVRFWRTSPPDGSKWLPVYRALKWIALHGKEKLPDVKL